MQMIAVLLEALRGRLPDGLRPRVESRVLLEETTAEGFTTRRLMRPDAMIVEYPDSYPKPKYSADESSRVREDPEPAVAEPVTITLIEEEIRERFIQIVDVKNGDRVITTIELLSLANKTSGGGREQFQHKQSENWRAGVSLV